MGRHTQIESILLRELTDGEERSQRAIAVIQHQQTTITELEEDLKVKETAYKEMNREIKVNKIEVEDYLKIQDDVDLLNKDLREIKEMQSQLFETNKIAQQGSKSMLEASVQTFQRDRPVLMDNFTEPDVDGESQEAKYDAMNDLQPVLDAFKMDLASTNKKMMETASQKGIHLKRKLESLRRKVKWLKQERDDMIDFLDELTEWRKHVEGILLDLSAGIQEDVGRVESGDVVSNQTRQIWKTARKFFTSDEAHFFLSHENET